MVAQLPADERARGVITYSSGNHGQAVAIAARALGSAGGGRDADDRAEGQVDGAKKLRRRSGLRGHDDAAPARRRAEEIAAARGLTMVPPFDHEWIIAGQGTLGLEILEQCPDVGTVLVPVGGGGLVSGVAAAIKLSRAGRDRGRRHRAVAARRR